jgi:hypothetical protein
LSGTPHQAADARGAVTALDALIAAVEAQLLGDRVLTEDELVAVRQALIERRASAAVHARLYERRAGQGEGFDADGHAPPG